MARVGNKAKSQMLKDLHLPDLLIPEEKQDTLWTASKGALTLSTADWLNLPEPHHVILLAHIAPGGPHPNPPPYKR